MRITGLRIAGLNGVIFVSLLLSCDLVHQELLPSDKRVVENPDAANYFITPHSAAAIDLKTLISFSASNLTLRISLDPKLGKLTPLREFLLRYDPSTKFLSGKDEFQIEIYEKDKVVKQLIVTINMREKAEDIPCGLYAIEDLLCVRPGIATSVLFAANDMICGSSVNRVVYSIYLQPEHGIAELRGDTILYSPALGYSGPDYMVYKLSIANEAGPPTESLGLISMPPPSEIRFVATTLNTVEGAAISAYINFDRSIACDDAIRIRVNGDAVYGSNYLTEPPAQDGIIEIPLDKGMASAAVKVTTINNDLYEGNKIIAFRLISSGAALNPDTVAVLTFTIGDDDGPPLGNFASFVQTEGTVSENSTEGITIEIIFTKPLTAHCFLYLFPSGPPNRITIKQPAELIYDFYNDYVFYRMSLAPGATGTAITLLPVNDQIRNGNYLGDLWLESSGCLTTNPNLKYRITVIDDD